MGKDYPYTYAKIQKNSLNLCGGVVCLAWIKEAGNLAALETIANAMERVHESSKAKRKKAGYSDSAIFLPYLGNLKGPRRATKPNGWSRAFACDVRVYSADADK